MRGLMGIVLMFAMAGVARVQLPPTSATLTGKEGYLGATVQMSWVAVPGPFEGGGRWQGQTTVQGGDIVTISLNALGTARVDYSKNGESYYTAGQTSSIPAGSPFSLTIPGLIMGRYDLSITQ